MSPKITPHLFFGCWTFILALILASCASNLPEKKRVNLTIFVGRSLKSTMEEIQEAYIQENKNINISYKFGSAVALEQSVERGDNADIYIASSGIKKLQSQGLLLSETQQDLVRTQIVLIVPKNTTGISDFKDLTSERVKKIALTDINKAVSGKYAQQTLKFLGILDQVQPKIILGLKDASEVVNYVEEKNADAGMVYATDALQTNQVKIVATAPKNSHQPIIFSMAVLKNSQNVAEAKEFLQFLQSEPAKAVFVKYRFVVNDSATP